MAAGKLIRAEGKLSDTGPDTRFLILVNSLKSKIIMR